MSLRCVFTEDGEGARMRRNRELEVGVEPLSHIPEGRQCEDWLHSFTLGQGGQAHCLKARGHGDGETAQGSECLLCKHEGLHSSPRIEKTKSDL